MWLAVGFLALGLAIAGAVLPLLPTTPFLILATYAFARSSPRFHKWLVEHPRFGPAIENWNRHGAIRPRAKRTAIIVIVLTPVVTWLIGAPLWALGLQILVLIGVATFILTRPDGPSADMNAR